MKVSVVLIAICLIGYFALKWFFRWGDDKLPTILEMKESSFKLSTAKPVFYESDNSLFFSENGNLDSLVKPIWKGKIEKAYVSPNSKYILIYAGHKLTLIDHLGNETLHIDSCVRMFDAESENKSGHFVSDEIQWNRSSEYFLISMEGKENKSTIYKYTISDRQLKPLVGLNAELRGSIFWGNDTDELYYEYATNKGDLAFKKVRISTGKVLSQYMQGNELTGPGVKKDSVFFNYVHFDENEFDCNSYDLKSLVTSAGRGDTIGLYLVRNDSAMKILSGAAGVNAFKGQSYGCFRGGYFLPGNIFFVADIFAENFKGQLIIDTRDYNVMKLQHQTKFYFNINSTDCKDFVFRYNIGPNFKYSTSAALRIEGVKAE